ncbi:MAG: permease [Candidatus Margulisiibacteriota bacterium]
MKKELKYIFILPVGFLLFYYFPLNILGFRNPFYEAIALLQWYAQEHVLTCLIPAFFIAGAISTFISQAAVIKYFGAKANKVLSYGIASISGTILAVCSCTVLPLFTGIYKRGAGLGPAIAFLYSGPAINVLAITLTASVLGWQLGLARAIGAILFSIVVGLLMHFIFIKDETQRMDNGAFEILQEKTARNLWQEFSYFLSMVLILIFANLARPAANSSGVYVFLFQNKWPLALFFIALSIILSFIWFKKDERKTWLGATWGFAKQIMPLLFIGVFAAGLFLGRPGYEGLIPSRIIADLVGGNSIFANFFASIVGAFMYFATLTEIPILQGLIGSGMGKGPALALLLAGPALSLPNMLVIRSVVGTKKTIVYVGLVVVMATISGMIFGSIVY